MAFGGSSGTDGAAPIADINITPLTDVMLVLLIIAMVIAPSLAFKGAQMNLPQVDKPQEFAEEDNLLQIGPDGALWFNEAPIEAAALPAAFQTLVEKAGTSEVTLILAADPAVAYQRVLDMWNLATANEIERIVLAGEVVDQYGNTLLQGQGLPDVATTADPGPTTSVPIPPTGEPEPTDG